jgi:hypothetical protein
MILAKVSLSDSFAKIISVRSQRGELPDGATRGARPAGRPGPSGLATAGRPTPEPPRPAPQLVMSLRWKRTQAAPKNTAA